MEFTEYDTRLAAYAVAVDDEDRILLALFNELAVPTWTLPGGGVELARRIGRSGRSAWSSRRGHGRRALPRGGGTTDEARWIPLADVPSLPRVALVDHALALLTRAASTDDTPFP